MFMRSAACTCSIQSLNMAVEIAESSGTTNQVEWAKLIKARVAAEFERIAAAFREVAGNQDGCRRVRTEAVLVILEEKRATVLANDQAGYFIRDWQEIGDQVRHMISRDERYPAKIRSHD
uniref:Uncharacterized protein n=1 Tax=Solibacter usitatus (strain Ellin6076) TaxID=234267 RepID=Q022Z1_SOLUE